MTDKTTFPQSLMHMLKSNLGTGALAMPASFAHCGLVTASIGLPILCIIAGYCVHLLVRSSKHLSKKLNCVEMEYTELAKTSFRAGPSRVAAWSDVMCRLVDAILIVTQFGICCVYLVFVVDNIRTILLSYQIRAPINLVFVAVLPVTLLLCYIRTLRRLSIASACANALQVVGICIIVEHLIREIKLDDLDIVYMKNPADMALGFGSAMFAFEGIAIVLPIFARMREPERMDTATGLINSSFTILLALYFIIGFLGYLRYGSATLGSITLNLPKEPLYDVVRAIFTSSILLTYPLQFYVPNSIIWTWAQQHLLNDVSSKRQLLYEYLCRTLLVLITFIMAMSVPKLNLVMDLAGSISGTTLSIILPAIIHMVTFWDDTSGVSRLMLLLVDGTVLLFGIVASSNGSYFSFMAIVESFKNEPLEL